MGDSSDWSKVKTARSYEKSTSGKNSKFKTFGGGSYGSGKVRLGTR